MRAHYCWRSIASINDYLESLAGAEAGAFALPGTVPTYPEDRPVVMRHLHLEVTIDPDKETIAGQVTALVLAMTDGVGAVRFDAADLEIESVYQQGNPEPTDFSYDGRYLDVALLAPLNVNDTCSIVIVYRVEKPRLGLYFIKPSAAEPDRPVQVWSQNQDDDARYWFPCMDHPGLKMTTSVVATVPLDTIALSNGVPGAENPVEHWEEGWHSFHWRQDSPHPIYLLTLLVGPFVEHQDEDAPVDLRWYCLPGREADAARSFGKTGEMVAFFSDYLQFPYPWPRYGQVAVSEFVFGGMENTTLTTVTERVLVDERAALDFSADSLVAHELAHQWFGDLVTCRDWSHGWLNEGFATYFDSLFKQHDLGQDEFDYDLWELQEGYFTEARTKYSRAVVTREYAEPIELFDRHLYHKGAWVLHMLRTLLGETPFRRGLHVYLDRFKYGQAETPDLRRALEDATGKSLGRFFDEWIHRPGYPKLKVRVSADSRLLTVTIDQIGDKSKPVWHVETELLVRRLGEEHRIPIQLDRKSQTIVAPTVRGKPDLVVLDPDNTVLCRQTMEVSTGLLSAALRDAPSVVRRIDAAKALGKKQSTMAFKALTKALSDDPFWGVRKQVAAVIGKIGTPQAEEALVAALAAEEHPKTRRGIAAALGTLQQSERASAALAELIERGEPSYLVEAEALRSIGRLRGPEAVSLLQAALDRPSFNDVIAAAGLSGLAWQRSKEALDLICARTTADQRTLIRVAAILAAGRVGRDVPDLRLDVLEALHALVADPSLRVQMSLLSALETVGVSQGIRSVQAVEAHGVDGRVKRRCREASRAIRKKLDRTAAFGELRTEIEQLRAEQKTLRGRVDRQEGRK